MNRWSDILSASERLAEHLLAHNASVTTIESCTGGLVGAAITALPGSSAYYPGGFVTYSNELKQCMVGVSFATLQSHGAVSAQTAMEMSIGGRRSAHADFAIAITGIAGPDGGSIEKPVGTVWICIEGPDALIDCRRFVFPGDRDQVREQSCLHAIEMTIQAITADRVPLPHEHERVNA